MQNMTPSTRTLENVAKEFLAKLPGRLPMPHFEIKNDYHPMWLGKCTWQPGEPNTTIEIQKSIFSDKETLRRTVAHELCHHCDYLENELPEYQKDPKAFELHERHRDGHGASFHKIASLLNSVFGHNFVVDKSDLAMELKHVPEYSILLMRDKSGRIYWAVAPHPNEEQRKHIVDLLAQKFDHREYKFTTSTDPLLIKGSPVGDGFSTPKSGKDPINHTLVDRLVELWKHGKAAHLPGTAHASEEDIFVPRRRVISVFAGGSVFYVHSSYTPDYVAVAATSKFAVISDALSHQNRSIAQPIMAARLAAKLPKNTKLTIPGQLHGIAELEFTILDKDGKPTDTSFLVYGDHAGTIGLDIMEGSNRKQLMTKPNGRNLWDDAHDITSAFTALFLAVKHSMVEAMQELGYPPT